MKDKALLFLLIIMPVVISAFSFQPYVKPLAQNQNSALSNPSITSINQSRDRNWRLDFVEKQNTNLTPGVLLSDEKIMYYYNDVLTTRIDSMHVLHYDPTAEDWVYDYTARFIYDATGEYVTVETLYNFNSAIAFVMINCFYDTQDRLVDMYQYNYNWTENQYYLVRRTNFTYTGNYLSRVMMINPGNGRAYYEKYTFDRDNLGRNDVIYGAASPDSMNWGNLSYEELSYHPNDTSTASDYIHFISHNMIFEEDWQGLYGMISEHYIFSGWNGVGWNSEDREFYTYNAANQITELLSQFFNGTFVNDFRWTYIYDTNSNLARRDRHSYDASMQLWGPVYERFVYTWGQFTSNPDYPVAPVDFGLSIYPNPFNNAVNISLDSKSNAPVDLEVYNLKGQLIKTLTESGKALVWDGQDRDNKPAGTGVYLIKALQDGKSTCRKIIRMR